MYSKIVSVEVVNFMVYAHGKIMFDEGNIINIKGTTAVVNQQC